MSSSFECFIFIKLKTTTWIQINTLSLLYAALKCITRKQSEWKKQNRTGGKNLIHNRTDKKFCLILCCFNVTEIAEFQLHFPKRNLHKKFFFIFFVAQSISFLFHSKSKYGRLTEKEILKMKLLLFPSSQFTSHSISLSCFIDCHVNKTSKLKTQNWFSQIESNLSHTIKKKFSSCHLLSWLIAISMALLSTFFQW